MVYRLNQDGVTSIPVSHYIIYSRYNHRVIAYKDLIYHEESSFSFDPVQEGKEDISDDSFINSLALSNDYHIYSATINEDHDYDFLSLDNFTDSNLLRFVIREKIKKKCES